MISWIPVNSLHWGCVVSLYRVGESLQHGNAVGLPWPSATWTTRFHVWLVVHLSRAGVASRCISSPLTLQMQFMPFTGSSVWCRGCLRGLSRIAGFGPVCFMQTGVGWAELWAELLLSIGETKECSLLQKYLYRSRTVSTNLNIEECLIWWSNFCFEISAIRCFGQSHHFLGFMFLHIWAIFKV